MTRSRNRGWAALVAASLVAIPAAPVQAAVVAGPWGTPGMVTAPSVADDAAPAAVVGLDADDAEQGAALTRALRKAFAARGLSGGKDANLSELRLALGCKNYAPECLARGGPMLDARRLIYGTLRRGEGTGWVLEATLLEVDGGATTAVSMPLAAADLEAKQLDATAATIADRLAPDTAVSATPAQGSGELAPPPPPAPEPAEPAEPEDDGADEDGGKGKLYFKWVKPQPRWKLAGFGTGLSLFGVGLAGYLGTSLYLTSRDGGFRGELVDTASASLTDDNALNDVDPNLPEGVNLCEYASARPTDPDGNPLGMPGQVRNSRVVAVCNKGDNVAKMGRIFGVVGLVGLVTTVTFTLLLLVHRKPVGKTARAWRRRGLSVDVDPVRGQGMSLRVGGRF